MESGALAGAVRTDDAEDAALFDAEIDAVRQVFRLLEHQIGERRWIVLADDGLGLCSGVLSDLHGAVAEVSQPLLVQQR